MTKSTSSHKARNTFLILFIVSTILALVLWLYYAQTYNPPVPVSGGHPGVKPPAIDIGALVAGAASCLTSIVSFFGFLATLFFGWRKDKREGTASELERQRLQIELEKQKLEISRLRAEEKQ
jgi:formate hydrogenlyase subunit 3/multisubunit Na+/H+ antiporter MnhD subunit